MRTRNFLSIALLLILSFNLLSQDLMLESLKNDYFVERNNSIEHRLDLYINSDSFDDANINEVLKRGILNLNYGLLYQARNHLRIVAEDPLLQCDAFYYLGLLYQYTMDLDSSEYFLKKVIQCNPVFIEAYVLLGDSYLSHGFVDKAMDAYNNALEINKQHTDAIMKLAYCAYLKGQYSEAIELSKSALKIDADLYYAEFFLGFIYQELRMFNEAVKRFERCMQIDSTNPAAYFQSGYNNIILRNADEAYRDFKSCMRLEPDNYELIDQMGICLIVINDYVRGFELVAESIEAEHRIYNDQFSLWGSDMVYDNIIVSVGLNTFDLSPPIHKKYSKMLYNDIFEKEKSFRSFKRYRGESKELDLMLNFMFYTHFNDVVDDHAMMLLDSIIITLPDQPYYRMLKSSLLFHQFRLAESLDNLNVLIDDYPDYAMAFVLRAIIYDGIGRSMEAAMDFNKALILDPFIEEAYLGLSNIRYRQGDTASAIKYRRKAIQTDPSNYASYWGFSDIFLDKKNPDSALYYINIALYINDSLPYLYLAKGKAYEMKNDDEAAIQNYTRALEISDTVSDAYLLRGLLHKKRNENLSAIDDLNKYLELKPNAHANYYDRGFVLMNAGQLDAALEDFMHVIEYYPDYDWTYVKIGDIYVRKKMYNESIDYYTKAITINPGFYHAIKNRAFPRFYLDDKEGAMEDIELALKLNPQYPYTYFDRGRLYSAMGETDKAIKDYKKCIELYPDYKDVYYQLNWSYMASKDYNECVFFADKTLAKWPEDLGAVFFKGMCSLLNDKFKSAEKYFARYKEITRSYSRNKREYYNSHFLEILNYYQQNGDFQNEISVIKRKYF